MKPTTYSAVWEHETHSVFEAVIWKVQDVVSNWFAYVPVVTLIAVFIIAGLFSF